MGALHSLGPSINGNATEAEAQALESITAQQMLETCRAMTEQVDSQPLAVIVQAFWDILLVKGHKIPHLACLLALVNRSHVTAVEAIVTDSARRLNEALLQRGGAEAGFGPSANQNAKTILRFYCALAALGVVSTTSVLTQLTAIVSSATQIARDAAPGGDVREWQPYADFLVEAVVLAVPWGLRTLQESDAFADFYAAVSEYFQSRADFMAELLPWSVDAADAATHQVTEAFVATAWHALQDVLPHDAPALRAIPRPQDFVDNAYNTSAVYDIGEIRVPAAAPVSTGAFDCPGVVVCETYPHRGVLPLLPDHIERQPAECPALEGLIMQEYYLHGLHAYAASGPAIVDQITTAIATPFSCTALLVELLISQMLLLSPPLTVFGYQSLLVRLVEHFGQTLAMPFGGCMKTLFEAAAHMDPFLLHRCGELLAVFISNNEYRWPWARWERVLEADGWSAQRRFCGTALMKLVRLSADLGFVQSKVLPRDNTNWTALIPASTQATKPPLDAGNLAQPYEEIMTWVREKAGAATIQQRLKERIRGGLGWSWGDTIQAFLHVLLIRGELAPQHTVTLLERYRAVLAEPDDEKAVVDKGVDGDGSEQGEALRGATERGEAVADAVGEGEAQRPAASVLLDTVDCVWESNSQRFCLAVLRLMTEELVTAMDVLKWLFSPAGDASWPRLVDGNVLRAMAAMELLLSVFDTCVSRTKAAKDVVKGSHESVPQRRAELAKVEEDMATAQRASQDASIPEEDRENLLARLQTLTRREAEAQGRLRAEEGQLEASSALLACRHGELVAAVRVALLEFIKAASKLEGSISTCGAEKGQVVNGEQTENDEGPKGADSNPVSGQHGEAATQRKVLHLLLQLMTAFISKYVPAAHMSAEFLREVLDEGGASPFVKESIRERCGWGSSC
jgi:hypothetical protein